MSTRSRAAWVGAIFTIGVITLGASFSGIAEVREPVDMDSAETFAHIHNLEIAVRSYVTTMGSVPPSLSDLWVKGTQPDLVFNPVMGVGAGWIGPYFPAIPVERVHILKEDLFGRDLDYIARRFKRPEDNQEVVLRIRSAGPDGVPKNADDIVSDTLASSLYSRVSGKVLRNSEPAAQARVFLRTPVNGVATQIMAVTDDLGVYVFENVPFGHRSIKADGASAFVNIHVAKAELEAPELNIRGF